MHTLLDTNILLRSVQPAHPDRPTALAAVAALLDAGRTLAIGSQSIYEFLAVATRPVAENGLGLAHADANGALEELLAGLTVLFDSAGVAAETRRLVVAHQVTGKKIHDTRLAATMNTQGITEILTFNGADFTRYRGIAVLHPRAVAQGQFPTPVS